MTKEQHIHVHLHHHLTISVDDRIALLLASLSRDLSPEAKAAIVKDTANLKKSTDALKASVDANKPV